MIDDDLISRLEDHGLFSKAERIALFAEARDEIIRLRAAQDCCYGVRPLSDCQCEKDRLAALATAHGACVCQVCKRPLAVKSITGTAGMCCECVKGGFPLAATPAPGEDGPCFYCGEQTCSVAGNPGRWPLVFCQPDGTGIARFHHTGCVTDRLFAATPAVGGEARIAVAEYLLARDEADGNVPVPHGLILWARNLLANGKDAVHSGDCTNECHSCVRCTADRALRQADEVLALAAPSASPLRGITDEMLNVHLKATAEWVDPYEAAIECGVPIECGITQDDADEFNAQSRASLRVGYAAALASSPERPAANGGWPPPFELMKLQVRKRGGDFWTDIYPAQLEQMIKQGCDVRAIEPPAAGCGDPSCNDPDCTYGKGTNYLAQPATDMFRCNCPHEVRSGCSEPRCAHYMPPRTET